MATPETDSNPLPSEGRSRPADRGWRPYRLSVRQYLKMIDAGVFPPQARVELMGGLLVKQMTKGTHHDFTLGTLCEQLRALLPAGWILREDKSLLLAPNSRPEPDAAIVAGPAARYKRVDPDAGVTNFVVEVADSTYRADRGWKWHLYAAAQIPTYWIVNLPQRRVEVYRDPVGQDQAAMYRTTENYQEDASVPTVIAGLEVGRIAVKDLLP